ELRPEFFRAKQREATLRISGSASAEIVPHPAYWQTFLAVLELAKKHRVRLIGNEVEESPYRYGSLEARLAILAFIRERVRPEVEACGFAYVRVDWDRFQDDDYFDYCHLNSKGGDAYCRLLSERLRSHLQP